MEDEKIINKVLGLSILALYSFIALFVFFIFGLSKVDALDITPEYIVFDSERHQYSPDTFYYPSSTTNFINIPLGSFKGTISLKMTFYYKVQTSKWFMSGSLSSSNIKAYLFFTSQTTNGSAYIPTTSCYSTSHDLYWAYYTCTSSFTYTNQVAESMVLQIQNPEETFGYNDGYEDSSFRLITEFTLDGEEVPEPEPSEKPDYSEIIDNSNKNNQQLIDSIQNGTLKDNSQPDNSKTNDYKDKEDKLIDKDSLNNINNIEISIDHNSNAFIWDLVNKILATNSLIYGLMITMLSIGIIKLVLNR